MDLPAWAVWVVIAVFMLAVEATTTAFFTIYFGVAAAIVALLSRGRESACRSRSPRSGCSRSAGCC